MAAFGIIVPLYFTFFLVRHILMVVNSFQYQKEKKF